MLIQINHDKTPTNIYTVTPYHTETSQPLRLGGISEPLMYHGAVLMYYGTNMSQAARLRTQAGISLS